MFGLFKEVNNQINSNKNFKLLAREYLAISIILIILILAFLWKIFFLGDVLLPADVVNTSVHPWVLAEGNAYSPGAAPYNRDLSDPIYIYYPMKHYLKASFDNGIIPLWNPNAFCGYPYTGAIIGEMFNPLDFLFLIFPTARAYGYSIAFHLFLAGIFMYAFSRSLRLNKIGALFAAIVFMFNANTVVWLEFPTHLKGELWIPLILMFIIKYYREKKISFAIAAGIFIGLQILSGYNQAVQFTVIALVILLIVNIVYDIIQKKYADIFKNIGATILAGIIGLLIGLGFLLPFYREFMDSHRAIQERAVGSTVNFKNLLTMLNPIFFGNNTEGKWFWLRGSNFIETVRYSGVVTLILAAIGAVFKRTKIVISFVIIIITVILINSVPFVFEAFNKIIPFFNKSGISRILMFVPLGLSVLSGYGLTYLCDLNRDIIKEGAKRKFWRMNRAKIILTIGLGILFMGIILLFNSIYDTHIDISRINEHPLFKLETFSFIFFLIMTLVSVVFIVLSLILVKHRKIFILLLIPLVILDLFVFGINFNTTSREDQIFFETPSIEYIKQDTGIYRILGVAGTLNPNSSWIFNMQEIGGYDPIIPLDYALFWTRFQGKDMVRPNGKVFADKMYDNFLNLTNTKYIMSYGFLDSRGYFVDNLDQMINKEDSTEIQVVTWNFHDYIIPTIVVPPDSKMEFDYNIAEYQELDFFISIHPEVWNSEVGDGVKYSITIEYDGKREIIFEKDVNPIGNEDDRRWFYESIDLNRYSSKKARIIFETSSKDNSENDIPGWGNPKIIPFYSYGTKDLVLKYNKEVKIYENKNFYPRAFMVHKAEIFDDREEIIDNIVKNRELDLSKVVLLEKANDIEIKELNNTGSGKSEGGVDFLTYENNYVKLEVNSEEDGYLVLLDRYDDDWKVYVDGETASMYKADYIFRAVYLAGGDHIVEFRYEPAWFKYSLIVSLAVLFGCIALVIYLYVRIRINKRHKL